MATTRFSVFALSLLTSSLPILPEAPVIQIEFFMGLSSPMCFMNKQLYLDKLKEIQLDSKDIIKAYNDISSLAMQCIDNINHNSNERNAYYFSMEFLMGRSFFNNLMELGVLEETKEILKEKGIDINGFEEIEDAALGNGGLGRLAACFLDSAANLNLPLHGYGIRFKYG